MRNTPAGSGSSNTSWLYVWTPRVKGCRLVVGHVVTIMLGRQLVPAWRSKPCVLCGIHLIPVGADEPERQQWFCAATRQVLSNHRDIRACVHGAEAMPTLAVCAPSSLGSAVLAGLRGAKRSWWSSKGGRAFVAARHVDLLEMFRSQVASGATHGCPGRAGMTTISPVPEACSKRCTPHRAAPQ